MKKKINKSMFRRRRSVSGCIFVYIFGVVDEFLKDNSKYEF